MPSLGNWDIQQENSYPRPLKQNKGKTRVCAVDVHVSVLVHLFPLDRNYCYGLVIHDTRFAPAIFCFDRLLKCCVNFCARVAVSCLTNKDLHTIHDFKDLVPYYCVDCPLSPPRKKSEKWIRPITDEKRETKFPHFEFIGRRGKKIVRKRREAGIPYFSPHVFPVLTTHR